MTHFYLAIILAAIGLSSAAYAQDAVTATCKDGSSWSGARRTGACRGHGGVQAFGTAATVTSAPPAAPLSPSQPAQISPAAVAAARTTSGRPATPPAQAGLGGGDGQVWVNTPTKVYHCPGDRHYGKTAHGTFMTESAAKAAGDRPDHGKACGLS